jgi:transposase
MEPMYYIGLDVHKRKISYCVKDSSGRVFAEGLLSATRFDLDLWMKTLPQPWSAAMEATMFTGWIYDHLQPHAAALKVAHPLMLRAIAAAKKKNDRIDARKICDCLRCDFLPECYMASTAIRERRRTLRYRNLLVRQMVQMKIKISALLMEAGVSYTNSACTKPAISVNCWRATRTSTKGCVRCCGYAARPWCGCRKRRVPWCARWKMMRC